MIAAFAKTPPSLPAGAYILPYLAYGPRPDSPQPNSHRKPEKMKDCFSFQFSVFGCGLSNRLSLPCFLTACKHRTNQAVRRKQDRKRQTVRPTEEESKNTGWKRKDPLAITKQTAKSHFFILLCVVWRLAFILFVFLSFFLFFIYLITNYNIKPTLSCVIK